MPDSALFEEAIDEFIDFIDSLATTLPMTMELINQVCDDTEDELDQFRAQHCSRESDDGEEYFVPHDDWVAAYDAVWRRYKRGILAYETMPRSFLVSALSVFDDFVGKLMKSCLRLHPELLNGSDRALTFAQLTEFSSLDDARTFVLEREVDAVARKTYTEQIEWFDTRFKTQILASVKCWPDFVELSERRNLFVHTGGKVSAYYIQNCRRHGFEVNDSIKIGDKLEGDTEYVEQAIERVYEVGTVLGHVLWRKLLPDERDPADSDLIQVIFELLTEGQYSLASRLSEFATALKKYSSEEARRIFVINHALSFKLLGDMPRAIAILEKEDWSASSDKFKIADAAIRGATAEAIVILRRLSTSDEIEKWQYREWPLFADLRTDGEFIAAFETVFNEPLNRVASDVTET